jgi:hypothetical protein
VDEKSSHACQNYSFSSHPEKLLDFPIQRLSGLKRLGHEAEHPSSSNARAWNAWIYTSTPTVRRHGTVAGFGRFGSAACILAHRRAKRHSVVKSFQSCVGAMRSAIISARGFGFKNIYSTCFVLVLGSTVKADDCNQTSSVARPASS